ncbi:GH32 C-terminal domain-containing protein [Bacillus inaquosorum]|uniref:GH32 C-terminal domain-containing protein n=1 Tax=Bacillus inaquosorum TaxID=483913 RepID=UPI0022813E4D|nr:GH32 C-terminal domain-containing protein [Bacillus inaquosorum]MCY7899331.1 GH32 C-terminal domain-containing protein [Bacillus inaquosorum]MCY8056557.1 GH32 C-terminal domain-containing protein [Bacillus inaquosorum]MCY8263081.1 GH32 C-terminal domain-containing protein [Bacillus inaquosorum]MCY8284318.1 GH32 C-terminal domain-containing protein [Bacillus inaquosorum]MCY9409725.1 GH32 C-terminal domain-containing protein [Bacillus inaquosorum]
MKKRLIQIVIMFTLLFTLAFPAEAADSSYYDEDYRPQYHFTPEANWMNDPNGMVYYAGEYHLFYQYHPYGMQWGPMHWGHAVSKDLVTWKHLPVALYPDEKGTIFSGSAVVDRNNTSGFQTGEEKPLVAIYTQDREGHQVQSIAYSNDKGRTWTKYAGNPVIPNPGKKDFRDPKVFWYEKEKKWVMVLAAGDRILIYTSKNLKQWTYASEFGQGQGSHGGVWECPDLFELPVDGNPNQKKWVMQVSVGNGAVSGGSGMQYFIGDFDGTHFKNENPSDKVLWTDYGKDFYAAVSWSDIPSSDGRRLWLGWMSNWQYANDVPTSPWRSAASIPRELKLKTLTGGVRVVQTPVKELQSIRGTSKKWKNQTISPASQNVLAGLSGDAYELHAEFQVSPGSAPEFGFKVRTGENQFTKVGYDRKNTKLFVDRSESGNVTFNPTFNTGIQTAPLKPVNGNIKMRIFVDRSSVEVFGNDGQQVITDIILPDRSSKGLELYAENGGVKLKSLTIYPLKKVWGTSPFISNLTGWTTANGTWADTIEGKQGRSDGDSFILSSASGSDFTYESDITIKDGNGRGAGALMFRSDKDAKNGYLANVDAKHDLVKFFKFENGVASVIAEYKTPIDVNKKYHLKTEAQGGHFKIYLDDRLVIDANDSTFSEGQFGLNVWDATAVFQNVNKGS